MRYHLGALACFGVLFSAPLCAQDIRIMSGKGDMMVLRGDPASPIPRNLDSALVTGDRILTGAKSQATVQVDPSHAFDLGPESEIRFGDVWPGHYDFTLMKGSLSWKVSTPNRAEVDVRTPSVSMLPLAPGVYDVSINADGESQIEPRHGVIQVVAATGAQWVGPGQKMLARGPYDNPEYQLKTSAWWRFRAMLANLQMGVGIATDIVGAATGGEQPKGHPQSKAAVAPNPHGESRSMSPPEVNHGGHSAPAPSHSAPSAPSDHHSAPSAPAASHAASALSDRSAPAATSRK